MTKTNETWLPMFPGFYETYLDPRNIRLTEYIYNKIKIRNNIYFLDLESDELEEFLWNKAFQYKDYEYNIAEQYVDVVGRALLELNLIEDIEFQSISSPKYYNFSNDSINISVNISPERIRKKVEEHYSEIKERLAELYSSHPGFIPYYSYRIEDWEKETNGFMDFDEHELGQILNLLLEIAGYEKEDFLDEIDIYPELLPQGEIAKLIEKEAEEREILIEELPFIISKLHCNPDQPNFKFWDEYCEKNRQKWDV